MKVCQITSMHNWDDDRIYQRACLGLAREGLDVHLVATEPANLPKNTNIEFHWIKPRVGWKRRWFSSKEAIKRAINVNADIYHFHDPDLLPHVLKLKEKLPTCKVIYDIHENYAGRFKNWGLPSFLGYFYRMYENKRISSIDGFTVVSSSMKTLFKNINTPCNVIRNSVDTSRLSNLNLEKIKKFEIPTIYTSGTNSHARHCLQTVIAMKYINKSKEFRLLFAGSYQDTIKEEMEMQSKKDKTEHLLEIGNILPWEENFERTAKAFCGCVFYEDNPNNRVGIPNRLFEYMYCGLPVIATDFPELRNIIKDTKCGILVDSENPKSIAEGFEYLLDNPMEAKEMGQRGKMAIENKYGYQIDLENTINFYRKMI